MLLSSLCVAALPLPYIVIKYGRTWRDARARKGERKRDEQEKKRQKAHDQGQAMAGRRD